MCEEHIPMGYDVHKSSSMDGTSSNKEKVRAEVPEISRAEALAKFAESIPSSRRERLGRGLAALEAVFKGQQLSGDSVERIDSAASAMELIRIKRRAREQLSSRGPEVLLSDERAREALSRRMVAEHWRFVVWQDGVRDEEGFTLFVEQYVRAQQAKRAESAYADRALSDDWLSAKDMQVFEQKLENIARDAQRAVESREAPELLRQFPDVLRQHIENNIAIVELTEGCSVRCTFCAFDAPGEVGASIPFSDIAWLSRRGPVGQFYYYATDPLDYHDTSSGRERTYADVLALTAHNFTGTSTAYPRGKKDIMRKIADRVSRVSVSKMNRNRLQTDGFFTITEKGSIIPTDPDLARALLAGDWRPSNAIYNFTDTARQYVSGRNFVRAHEEGHANGDSVGDSIACRNGVIYGPTKLRNTVRTMTTERYPRGVAEEELLPENLLHGAEKMKGIIARVQSAEHEVSVNELLACGVVCELENVERPLPQVSLHGRTVEKTNMVGFLAPIRLLVWNEEQKSMEAWMMMYEVVEGYVVRIDPDVVPDILTDHNRHWECHDNQTHQWMYAQRNRDRLKGW